MAEIDKTRLSATSQVLLARMDKEGGSGNAKSGARPNYKVSPDGTMREVEGQKSVAEVLAEQDDPDPSHYDEDDDYDRDEDQELENQYGFDPSMLPDEDDLTTNWRGNIEELRKKGRAFRELLKERFVTKPVVASLVAHLESVGFSDDDYYYILVMFLETIDKRMVGLHESTADIVTNYQDILIEVLAQADMMLSQLRQLGYTAETIEKLEPRVQEFLSGLTEAKRFGPQMIERMEALVSRIDDKSFAALFFQYASIVMAMGLGLIIGIHSSDKQMGLTLISIATGAVFAGLGFLSGWIVHSKRIN